jgi:beta-1,4-mannosyl-glycoprotein beta-1,4-N-acetylglucosaminyltransferase
MKIVDCFLFYNELDMLKYRLELLNDTVDYFVIVESTHTFAGYPKDLHFNNNAHMFSKFEDKIIYIIVDDLPYKQPNVDFSKKQQWENEYFNRNCISRGIDKINLSDEDIIMGTDLDEIPNPAILSKIKNSEIKIDRVVSLYQDIYYYNLTTRVVEDLYGTRVFTYKFFKSSNMSFHQIRNCSESVEPQNIIRNGGWHLDHFGDEYVMLYKLQTSTHQEYNTPFFTDLDYIRKCMSERSSVFTPGKMLTYVNINDNTNLPPKWETYLSKYT